MLQRKVPPPPRRFWGKKIRRLSFCRRVRTSCMVALTVLEALPIGLQQGTFLSRPEQPAHSMHACGGGQLTASRQAWPAAREPTTDVLWSARSRDGLVCRAPYSWIVPSSSMWTIREREVGQESSEPMTPQIATSTAR